LVVSKVPALGVCSGSKEIGSDAKISDFEKVIPDGLTALRAAGRGTPGSREIPGWKGDEHREANQLSQSIHEAEKKLEQFNKWVRVGSARDGNNNQSATNPCQRFRYDNSTGFKSSIPSGISPQYVLGRMVEAATDNCGGSGDPVLTDEWFSYSARGQQTDMYESTPNSGGWYHTTLSYWNNGSPGTLMGYLGTGTTAFTNSLNYFVDGEGRLKGLWDGTVSKSICQSPADRARLSTGSCLFWGSRLRDFRALRQSPNDRKNPKDQAKIHRIDDCNRQ
jgi:hypothetical protein